jgi:hypothetical protein
MDSTFLTRLLPDDFTSPHRHERFRAALDVDPALKGRVLCDEHARITLTGPGGGLSPGSVKERQRWEMHVRLRLAAELGDDEAAVAVVRWADASASPTGGTAPEVGAR